MRLLDPAPVTVPEGNAGNRDDDECDVLTTAVFQAGVTELLLAQVPTLTGTQIVQVRQQVLTFARSHGWIED